MSPDSPKETRRVRLPRSEHRPPRQGRKTGKTSPRRELMVTVVLHRKQPIDLQALGGRHVSREEYAANYGAPDEAIQQVRAFAEQHGLTVQEAAPERRRVFLRGTVENFEKAFGVELDDYEHPGGTFHAFTGAMSVPESLVGVVEAVLGLDARPIATPHIRYRDGRRAGPPAAQGNVAAQPGSNTATQRGGVVANPHAVSQSFTPPQVGQIYDFPTGVDGTGQCIGIIELGGGFQASDIQTYFQQLGIPAPTVVAVSVDGGSNTPGTPPGADDEVALDIQVAGSVAPGAKIAVYFAPNTNQGFQDAVSSAMHDTANQPSVISISWGAPEDAWPQNSLTSFDSTMQGAAALGITITAASGDNGSSDGETGDHVDFPASSPHVLGCGGTSLQASNGARQSETVWNDQAQGGGASGGGVSSFFPPPSWQANAGVPPAPMAGGGRGVPDVSGDAAPGTGYQVLVNGQQKVVGGTSAVAPLCAGLVALINQQLGKAVGFINPALYAGGGSGFFDVTQGSNGTFSAGPGWDACTGLGSPDGQQIATVLGSASTGS